MKHFTHTSISLLLLLITMATLLGCGADKNLKKGEKYLAIGEYYDAATQFKQAYTKTSTKEKAKRGDIALKIAYCNERINSTQKAQAAYANAIRYGRATAADRLSYARQLLRNGSYKQAGEQFAIVLDSINAGAYPTPTKKGNTNTLDANAAKTLAQNGLIAAQKAPEWKKQGSRYKVKRMDVFNSRRDDYSPDQHTMYLTQCTSDPSYPRYAQIVTSARANAAWGKPSELKITGDTLSSYAHPAVSPDGMWLYFVSDMPGGMGGMDIWRARITPAGLGGVENLGAPINTPGNEMFPTFRPNGDLYFSSDGHPGMGGLDIFIASVGKDGKYHLEHPGYPLNSQGDDFGMTFEGVHNRGYFSSSRNDGRGWDHIYSFENPEIIQSVKGWVYEQDGYELPSALVYLVGSDGTNEKLSVKGDGSFEKVLKPGTDYIFLATCKGFLNHKEELSIGHPDDSNEHVLQFPLASITAPVLIDNIFYDFDKATLRPESQASLDELVKLLNENPNVTIELSSHCDYKGSAEYNKLLSQRRAESVVEYLTNKGISRDRLSPVGYGKEKPKTIRKKLTEKYNWLKENDVLTEEFIKKLDKDKQDICNQLNRRTEFIVLRTTYGMFDKDGNLKKSNNETTKKSSSSNEKGKKNEDFDFYVE